LQKIQNNAARIITRTKRREHISPVLRSLHWLPILSRIDHKIMSLTFKAINNLAPKYLQEMITIYEPTRTLDPDLPEKDQTLYFQYVIN